MLPVETPGPKEPASSRRERGPSGRPAGLLQFLFVPMLTTDDGKEGGDHDLRRAGAGLLNRDLVDFLDRCSDRKERDVTRIRSYFDGQGIAAPIFGSPFTHKRRRDYFYELLAGLPPSCLVLLDPDNGLENRHPDE